MLDNNIKWHDKTMMWCWNWKVARKKTIEFRLVWIVFLITFELKPNNNEKWFYPFLFNTSFMTCLIIHFIIYDILIKNGYLRVFTLPRNSPSIQNTVDLIRLGVMVPHTYLQRDCRAKLKTTPISIRVKNINIIVSVHLFLNNNYLRYFLISHSNKWIKYSL